MTAKYPLSFSLQQSQSAEVSHLVIKEPYYLSTHHSKVPIGIIYEPDF